MAEERMVYDLEHADIGALAVGGTDSSEEAHPQRIYGESSSGYWTLYRRLNRAVPVTGICFRRWIACGRRACLNSWEKRYALDRLPWKHGKLGVGNCTSGFDFCVKGCPPTETEIYEALKRYIVLGTLTQERETSTAYKN